MTIKDDHFQGLGIVVTHTHWDREWRTPMWTSRYHLMHFMDSLLELLEKDERFTHMVLDGQSVILQDYLEMAPHQRARLTNLIKAGRIAVGPWYTLPDLYPVGGETLIRNLTKGMALSRELGYNPTIAYTTFGWGQSSQMPQIYHGFGLDFIITAKHVSPERVPDIEFLWCAPDGTQVLTSRLGDDARANFFFNAYIPIRYGIRYKEDEYRYRWGTSTVFKSARNDRMDEDYHTLVGNGSYHKEEISIAIERAWEAYGKTKVPEVRLLLDGSDATLPQTILPRIIEDAKQSGVELLHGSLETYAALLRERLDENELQIVEGELRDGPAAAVTGNALAVRIGNKQLNARCELLLTRIAEPLLAWAALLGVSIPYAENFREKAWEYLLKAHCHDSINGVGQDKNSQDTNYRLRQVEELATVLTDGAVGEILKLIDTGSLSRDETLLFVYNPFPFARRSTISISLNIPLSEHAWDISLVDSTQKAYPVQIENRQERLAAIDDPDARPWTFDCHRIEGLVTTSILPPYGWEVFTVQIDETFTRNRIWPPARVCKEPPIGYGNYLENAYLKATVQHNGTLCLEDKVRGLTYTDLLIMEDAGDLGDYWVYSPPYSGGTVLSTGTRACITQLSNGPEQGQIAIDLDIMVPSEAILSHRGLTNEGQRNAHLVPLTVRHILSLRRDEPFLRIQTTIENRAKDHRVRIRFPLAFHATHSVSMSHFHLDARPAEPTGIPGDAHGYWPDMQTHPMRSFVDVTGGDSALAVLTDSFFEYGVETDEVRSDLVLTAFRSVRNKICTEFRTYTTYENQEGGQSLGKLEYQYALYPHGNDPDEVPLIQVAESYHLDPLVYQFSSSPKGTLSRTHSMFSTDNPMVRISAILPPDDDANVLMRLWNASNAPQSCTLSIHWSATLANHVSFDGKNILGSVSRDGKSVLVDLGPCEIVTLQLREATT